MPAVCTRLSSCCSLGRRRHGREPGLLGPELLLGVHLHVVAEHEARVVGGALAGGGGRRSDARQARRVVEGGDGAAVAVPGRQDAVPRALIPPVAQNLQWSL